jgi:hypothetical protein
MDGSIRLQTADRKASLGKLRRPCLIETAVMDRASTGRRASGFFRTSRDRVPEPAGHPLSSWWSSGRHTGASGGDPTRPYQAWMTRESARLF